MEALNSHSHYETGILCSQYESIAGDELVFAVRGGPGGCHKQGGRQV
jgi:hypothetical protein